MLTCLTIIMMYNQLSRVKIHFKIDLYLLCLPLSKLSSWVGINSDRYHRHLNLEMASIADVILAEQSDEGPSN